MRRTGHTVQRSVGHLLRGDAALAPGRSLATRGPVPARCRWLGRKRDRRPCPGRADRRPRLCAAGTERLDAPDRDGAYWSLGARPPVRDEDGFLEQILADAAPRFHLDRSRVFVTGFSMGAGLVWQLACRNPAAFAAYGPIAGGFWNGSPKACVGPVRLLLTHGWRDDAVPIEGWEQEPDLVEGGAFDGAQFWRRVSGCPDAHAGKYAAVGGFWLRSWTGCAPGSALTFVLHPGGHEVPAGWAAMALDWFEAVVPASH